MLWQLVPRAPPSSTPGCYLVFLIVCVQASSVHLTACASPDWLRWKKRELWLSGARALWIISLTATYSSTSRAEPEAEAAGRCGVVSPIRWHWYPLEPFAESRTLPGGDSGCCWSHAKDSCARNVSGRPRRSVAMQNLELDVSSIFPIIGSWAVVRLGPAPLLHCMRTTLDEALAFPLPLRWSPGPRLAQWRPNTSSWTP